MPDDREKEKRARDASGIPYMDTTLLNTLPGVHTKNAANADTGKVQSIPTRLIRHIETQRNDKRLIHPDTYESIARLNAVLRFAPSLKCYVCLVPMKAYIRIKNINPSNDVWVCELWEGEPGTAVSVPSHTPLLLYIN